MNFPAAPCEPFREGYCVACASYLGRQTISSPLYCRNELCSLYLVHQHGLRTLREVEQLDHRRYMQLKSTFLYPVGRVTVFQQISAQPRMVNASWMSRRRSYRIANRRNWFNHAKVRSTTHRCRPSRWLDSMPFRAIRPRMCRLRRARRHFGWS